VRDIAQEEIGVAVDVMTRGSIHPYLRQRIEAEAIQVF
jgi:predicted nucleotidyltransferase